jgi:hypothetical protein
MIMTDVRVVIPYSRQVMVETHLHVIECARCNIDFGIGDDFMRRRREDHEDFYCPNGHPNVYRGPTEVEKERDRLKRQLEFSRARASAAEDQAETAERRRRAQKAVNTKMKKRAAAGLCQVCNRTFQNVHDHMETKHPDYPEADHGTAE